MSVQGEVAEYCITLLGLPVDLDASIIDGFLKDNGVPVSEGKLEIPGDGEKKKWIVRLKTTSDVERLVNDVKEWKFYHHGDQDFQVQIGRAEWNDVPRNWSIHPKSSGSPKDTHPKMPVNFAVSGFFENYRPTNTNPGSRPDFADSQQNHGQPSPGRSDLQGRHMDPGQTSQGHDPQRGQNPQQNIDPHGGFPTHAGHFPGSDKGQGNIGRIITLVNPHTGEKVPGYFDPQLRQYIPLPYTGMPQFGPNQYPQGQGYPMPLSPPGPPPPYNSGGRGPMDHATYNNPIYDLAKRKDDAAKQSKAVADQQELLDKLNQKKAKEEKDQGKDIEWLFVSGRKGIGDLDLDIGSQDDFELFCDPCHDVEGTFSKPMVFCPTCNEYMCTSCLNAHRLYKKTRNHEVLRGDDMPASKPPEPTAATISFKPEEECTDICEKHSGQIIRYFCKHHNCLGCMDCIAFEHNCASNVVLIADISSEEATERDFQRFSEKLVQLSIKFSDSAKTAENHVKDAEAQFKRAKDDASEFSEEMINKIRTLKTEVEGCARVIKDTDCNKMQGLINQSNLLCHDVKQIATEFESLQKCKRRAQQFTFMKKMLVRLEELEKNGTIMDEHNFITSYGFCPDKRIKNSITDAKRLGKIDYESKTFENNEACQVTRNSETNTQ